MEIFSLDFYKYVNKELSWLSKSRVKRVLYTEYGYEMDMFSTEGRKFLYINPPFYIFYTNSKLSEGKESSLASELEKIGVIEDFRVLGLNRTLILEGKDLKIIIEMYPPGNIIITDSEWKIEKALIEKNFGKRKIFRGEIYQVEESKIPNEEEIANIKESKKDSIVKALAVDLKIGGLYAEELCRRAGINKELKPSEVDIRSIIKSYKELLNEYFPCKKDNTVTTIKVEGFIPYSTLSEAIISLVVRSERKEDIKENIEERIKELEEKIQKVNEYKYKILEAQEILKEKIPLEQRKKKIEDLGIKYEGSYFNFEGIEIGVKENVNDFLNELFEKLKRLKKALNKPITIKPENYIVVETTEWYGRFRYTFTKDNSLLIWGKDLEQNRVIIEKYTNPEDLVFHADVIGAPFVVLKGNPTEENKQEGSLIAAAYSSLWKSLAYNGDVIVVKGEQVTKSPPSGEYLKKGAFYIEGKREIIKTPIYLYISITKEENTLKILPKAYKPEGWYILIEPDKERNISRLMKIFEKKLNITFNKDKIDKIIPAGGFRIKELHLD